MTHHRRTLADDVLWGRPTAFLKGVYIFMDFIAEIVPGYADSLLIEKLEKYPDKKRIVNYKILRYRDDYRIFSQSAADNEIIIKCLAEVMISLGL